MRPFTPILWIAIAAAVVPGCSAGNQASQNSALPSEGRTVASASVPMVDGSPIPTVRMGPINPGWLSPAVRNGTSGPVVYAAVEGDNEVLIYPEVGTNQAPIGKITNGISAPWGLWVDKNGNLYVANSSGKVTVYPPGSVDPSATYSKDLYRPLYVIADQAGDVFAGNGNGTKGGTLVEFLAGSSSVHEVLKTPGTEVDGMDFDQQGNLYVAYRGGMKRDGLGSVEKFAPGSTQGEIIGMKVHQPQGLIVDNEGNVLVAETSQRWRAIALFRPGKTRPTLRLKLPTGSDPTQIAITADESELFAGSFQNNDLYVTPYPLTKASAWTALDQIPNQLEGVALSNGQGF
jgi:hypothetical protein